MELSLTELVVEEYSADVGGCLPDLFENVEYAEQHSATLELAMQLIYDGEVIRRNSKISNYEIGAAAQIIATRFVK